FADDTTTLAGADLNRAANFDGQRFDDVLFQNAANGQLVFAAMNAGSFVRLGVATGGLSGSAGHWTVGGTGDINGDGFADIFVQDPANGSVYVAEQAGTGTPAW